MIELLCICNNYVCLCQSCSISGIILCLIVLLPLYIVHNTCALTPSSKGWFLEVAMTY